MILCQITSVASKDEYAIELNDKDFVSGSLMKTSYIRPNKLFTADKQIFLRYAGHISPDKIKEVITSVSKVLNI